MSLYIYNVRPFINGKICKKTSVSVENGKIVDIGAINKDNKNEIDGEGAIIASGYIDIHTHGGYGHDVMEGTNLALSKICEYHFNNGTTTFIPTTLTASIEDTIRVIEEISAFKSDKSEMYGIHLEGPFLSPTASGAHPGHLLKKPILKENKWISENIKKIARMTLAPDLEGASEMTKFLTQNGVQVSCGHDASIDTEIFAMLDNGASSTTHLYNCTSRPSRRTTPHKHLGLTEVSLIDNRIIAEVIADDRHVPNALFDMIYKLKGAKGICLVSDSLSVADSVGDMFLGSGDSKARIEIQDGVAIIVDKNTYAGSVTPVSKMAKMLVARGYSVEDSLTMATLTPSKLMKMKDRGDIKVGYLAHFNILDDKLNIIRTIMEK